MLLRETFLLVSRAKLTAPSQGETIIDLGSGAGFDVFLAANKVGPNGTVIGVDMNKVSRPGPSV